MTSNGNTAPSKETAEAIKRIYKKLKGVKTTMTMTFIFIIIIFFTLAIDLLSKLIIKYSNQTKNKEILKEDNTKEFNELLTLEELLEDEEDGEKWK